MIAENSIPGVTGLKRLAVGCIVVKDLCFLAAIGTLVATAAGASAFDAAIGLFVGALGANLVEMGTGAVLNARLRAHGHPNWYLGPTQAPRGWQGRGFRGPDSGKIDGRGHVSRSRHTRSL